METELIQARIAKKLTQIELAKLCNLESKVVRENERIGCIYNAQVWNKLCKELGVKIERNVD
jgi:ribosome-binding protein aMBF1 (putative translation factor)